MMIGVLRSYIDDFLSTESTEDSIPALNAVSQVLEDAEVQFLSLPRHNLDSSRAPSRSEAMCGHLSAGYLYLHPSFLPLTHPLNRSPTTR